MLLRFLAFIMTAAMFAPVPGAVESVEEAKQKLTGVWRAVSAERHGFPHPPEDVDALRLVITGEKVVFKWATKEAVFSYRVDPSTDPKQLDMTCLNPEFKNILCRGIYKFDGDQLSICSNTRGTQDRPLDYKTSLRNGFATYVLKREKP